MAYSIDTANDGCYPGTTILINKLEIRPLSMRLNGSPLLFIQQK